MRIADVPVPAEWAAETLVNAEFHGDRDASAPMTWSQQVMWRAAARSTNHHLFMNLRRTVPLSARARVEVPAAARAIGALLSRHGALRTRVRPGPDGLRQEEAVAGRAPILVVDGDGDGSQAAEQLVRRLGDVAFDHAGEWPQRFGLVLADGLVRQVVVVFSHATVDAYAVDVVLRDLRLLLLRGSVPDPAGLQSVDVGLTQHGPDRARSERAVRHWLHQYERLPRDSVPMPGPELVPRIRRGVLVSTALAGAARLIAARHRVSDSAVLLAGMAALAAGRSGQRSCGLFNMAHNRFRAEYRSAVANLGQIGFSVLDVADRPSFDALLPRIWRVSLDSLRHAYYDPAVLRQAFEEAGYDYLTAFLPYYYFNDVRLPATGGGAGVPEVTEAQLRAAAQRSAFSWTAGLDVASWHLLTHVVDEPGGVGVTFSVDTRFLPPESIEPFLRDLEELLIEAAYREVPWPWQPAVRG